MSTIYIPEMGFFEALFGLIMRPHESTARLFSEEPPPHVSKLLFCLFFILAAPILYSAYYYGADLYRLDILVAIVIFIASTLLFFTILNFILLAVFGLEITLYKVFATAVYCLTPLILICLLVYILNYLSVGSISTINVIFQKSDYTKDKFLSVMPFVILFCKVDIFLLHIFSLRAISGLHFITALCLTLLSGTLLYLIGMISLKIVNFLVFDGKTILLTIADSPAFSF